MEKIAHKFIIKLLNVIFSRVKPFSKNLYFSYQKKVSPHRCGYENLLGYSIGKHDRYITWLSRK